MNRSVNLVVRIVLILVLLSGIGALFTQMTLQKTVTSLDDRFLPMKSSLQAHAERLALHISNRLMQPPLPVLPDSLSVPVDSLHYGSLNLPPHLETANLPQRYPLSWSKNEGWLCDPPPVKQMFLERFFMRTASRPGWTTPSMTTMVMDPEDMTSPMILAGTWTFAGGDASFHGALTPVGAFYDVYAQRWFDEYCHASYGLMLKSWVWKPVEFKLVPHNTDRDPVILRASQTVDTNDLLEADNLEQFSSDAATIAAALSDQVNPEPNWQENAEWFEAALFPIPDKILVATPFQMDLLFQQRIRFLTWWAIVAFLITTIGMPLTWIRKNAS